MKHFRIIPFGLYPSHWRLTGVDREMARIRYYYDGAEREERLFELKYPDPIERKKASLRQDYYSGKLSDYEYEIALLRIDGKTDPLSVAEVEFRHGNISQYDFEKVRLRHVHAQDDVALEKALLELDYEHGRISEYDYRKTIVERDIQDEVEKTIALVELDFSRGLINENQKNKLIATARMEPWVGVVDQEFNPRLGINGFGLELDWNEYWIEFLRLNGYTGASEVEVVDQWFLDVCRSTTGDNVRISDYPARDQFVQRNYRGDGRTDYM